MIGVIIVRYNGCVFSQASSQIFSDNKKVFRTEARGANILLGDSLSFYRLQDKLMSTVRDYFSSFLLQTGKPSQTKGDRIPEIELSNLHCVIHRNK